MRKSEGSTPRQSYDCTQEAIQNILKTLESAHLQPAPPSAKPHYEEFSHARTETTLIKGVDQSYQFIAALNTKPPSFLKHFPNMEDSFKQISIDESNSEVWSDSNTVSYEFNEVGVKSRRESSVDCFGAARCVMGWQVE